MYSEQEVIIRGTKIMSTTTEHYHHCQLGLQKKPSSKISAKINGYNPYVIPPIISKERTSPPTPMILIGFVEFTLNILLDPTPSRFPFLQKNIFGNHQNTK